jgi:hypothetical protein
MNNIVFIELTNYTTNKKIYLNVNMIGDISRASDHDFNREPREYTSVGHLTHNNGGFRIVETPEQIMSAISFLNK